MLSAQAAKTVYVQEFFHRGDCTVVGATWSPDWTEILDTLDERFGTPIWNDPSCNFIPGDIDLVGYERTHTDSCPANYTLYAIAVYINGDFSHFNRYCQGPPPGYIASRPLECPANGGPSTKVGDPCDVSTGDFSRIESDYSATGLSFTRYYHSATLESHHALGTGWMHNYAAYLVLSSGTPTGLLRPDGHHDTIQFINGEYESLSGAGIHVQQSSSNWIAYLGDGRSEIYNSAGQLIQTVSAAAQVTTLAYNATGQLSSVTGPFGHSLQFTYNANGQVQQ